MSFILRLELLHMQFDERRRERLDGDSRNGWMGIERFRGLAYLRVFFFFAGFSFPFLAAARWARAKSTTRCISCNGAGLPLQISNWRAPCWSNISDPRITCMPLARAILTILVSAGALDTSHKD